MAGMQDIILGQDLIQCRPVLGVQVLRWSQTQPPNAQVSGPRALLGHWSRQAPGLQGLIEQ